MNGSVVVDASLAVKWLLNEIDTDKALALARLWAREGTQPVAPYLIPVEVANALHRRIVRSELSLAAAARLLDALLASGIGLVELPGIHASAIELATDLGQGAVYDAHYLALAEALGCPLWTADQRFYRAAHGTHPSINWLGLFSPGPAA